MNEAQLNNILDAQFAKLYGYMNKRLDQLEAKLETKADKSQIERIFQILDGIVARLDTAEIERAAQNHQLNRHQDWIKKVGNKIKLNYDLIL
ncbi:MAG TPA: hypothetical protein VNX65_02690 [Patescibacteria group bacterium]|jgi:hypothetical protein|nr:hypothetical protein [Patescibacteria group bacterium]